MRKWWRRLKNKFGWDFEKREIGLFFYRETKGTEKQCSCSGECLETKEMNLVSDPNHCYCFVCKYCNLMIRFPWKETHLAYHNMQRHIKAKHL